MTTTVAETDLPHLVDNDKGIIFVRVRGHRVRDWIYANDDERRQYMALAREYIEGWYDAKDFVEALRTEQRP